MSTVIFRADANHNIGMGHMMRCLSIADSFKATHCLVEFIIADDTVASLIQSRGYKTIVLNSHYDHMEEELDSWPQDIHADFLVVDSYYVTSSYLSSLRDKMRSVGGKLVYIDDVLSFPYPVDILINYNAYANLTEYEELYNGKEVDVPQFILGSIYTPLRSMFRGVDRRSQTEKVENILISTGGSDELHLTLALVRNITDSSVKADCVYHFLIGAMNEDKEEIKRVASEVDNVSLHENVQDMRSLIERMGIVVSAAGSTLYEISACGVPLITYSLADNQIPGGEAFQNLGIGKYIGDLREPDSIDHNAVMSGRLAADAVDIIMNAVEDLAADYKYRVEMGKKMQKLIDGYGADRMVNEILHPYSRL